MYISADINKIVENEDLYRNKDDWWEKYVFFFKFDSIMEVAKNNFLVDSPLIRGEGVRGCPQRKEPFLMFFF